MGENFCNSSSSVIRLSALVRERRTSQVASWLSLWILTDWWSHKVVDAALTFCDLLVNKPSLEVNIITAMPPQWANSGVKTAQPLADDEGVGALGPLADVSSSSCLRDHTSLSSKPLQSVQEAALPLLDVNIVLFPVPVGSVCGPIKIGFHILLNSISLSFCLNQADVSKFRWRQTTLEWAKITCCCK